MNAREDPGPPWVWCEEMGTYRLDESLPHAWTQGKGPHPFSAVCAADSLASCLDEALDDLCCERATV